MEERKRKFLLVAPLVVLPFLAMIFFAIGGGRASVKVAEVDTSHGLNSELPSPQLSDDGSMDKLSLYRKEEKEHKDSLQHHQADKEDALIPSLQSDGVVESPFSPGPVSSPANPSIATEEQSSYHPAHQSTEDRLTQKVAALQALLAKHAADTLAPPPTALAPKQDTQAERRIATLEAMLQQQTPELTGDGTTGGSDLRQMDGMLDKVLDIQHPERVQERLRKTSVEQKGKVLAVVNQSEGLVPDLLEAPPSGHSLPATTPLSAKAGQFFELDDQDSGPATTNTISAVIHEGRTVTSGATVKIRLQQDIYIQGHLIPNGTFLYGKCSFSGDRLLVTIASVTYQGNLYPVALSVYDTGGMAGIPIDASLNQDAAKEGSQQAIQALSMGTLDPSLGAQAASAGIETAKQLLSKKIKIIKVTLKADYPVLLVDSKNI